MLLGVDKSYGIEQVISSCRSTGRVEAKSADGTVDPVVFESNKVCLASASPKEKSQRSFLASFG